MTGTEKIIAHIEQDAREQAEAILTAAKEKCAEIQKQYEEKASKLYTDRIRDGVKACQDREDGALRIARMEARKSILGVKQDMVTKSFEQAQKTIIGLPQEKYTAFLAQLVKEASTAGDEEIILNARDREAIGQALLKAVNAAGAKHSLAKETGDMAGGLILRRGNVETNCSVELLVEMSKSELSGKLAELLFG